MNVQPMANAKGTIFIVQAFVVNKSNVVTIEAPRLPKTEAAALAMAEQLSATKTGVVVFSREMDFLLGEYEAPQILATHGDIPVDVTSLWEG